jgi:hypothetical protein
MRFKDSIEQESYLKHASELGNVELVYAGLDVLGSTPWEINKDVFDVVLKVWNSGERMGKLPPAVYDKPEPETPPNVDSDIKAKSIYVQRMKGYNQSKANNHSERCNVNYKIEIARAVSWNLLFFMNNCLTCPDISSLVTKFTFPTTWISAVVPIPFHPILTTLVTTSVVGSLNSANLSRWASGGFGGLKFIWPTCTGLTKPTSMTELVSLWTTWTTFTTAL